MKTPLCRLAMLCIVLLSSLGWTGSALAIPLHVDPGDFEGSWRVWAQTGVLFGPATIDLPPGSHQMIVAGHGQFDFDIDANGVVTSHNPGAASGGVNTLDFSTSIVHVDPGNFLVQSYGTLTAQWIIQGTPAWQTAASDIALVKGLKYMLNAGTFGGFAIFLDQNGDVSVDNGVSAVTSGNTVTFNTIPIDIDPAGFLNQPHPAPYPRWSLSRVIAHAATPATLNVVPGVRYSVVVGSVGQFFIHVDDTGNITVENGFSAVGGYRNLTFNTVTIHVDPGEFLNQADGGATANWHISRVASWSGPASDVVVVPGVHYTVTAGAYGAFFIDVDEFGDVSVRNGISAQATGNSLEFNTETIQVDPGSFTGDWSITYALHSANGAESVKLVPGVRYRLAADGTIDFFNVYDPCSVDPPVIGFPNSSFSLSCGLPDADGDGVPDASDNCPALANAAQLDQDLDGLGDACDDDYDGDGTDNALDNCPGFYNPAQSDLDGDGLGDECDADTDGDSVSDETDNCPLIHNPGQGDSDSDGAGDACDVDDDQDGVADAADNCPLTWNPLQSDFDSNGQGDACDGDVDGDFVFNEDDACAATPLDQAVTENGCSGSQFVALQCPRESFNQHGRYVSCVAHTAGDLARAGIIENREKSIFVKEAAKNK